MLSSSRYTMLKLSIDIMHNINGIAQKTLVETLFINSALWCDKPHSMWDTFLPGRVNLPTPRPKWAGRKCYRKFENHIVKTTITRTWFYPFERSWVRYTWHFPETDIIKKNSWLPITHTCYLFVLGLEGGFYSINI